MARLSEYKRFDESKQFERLDDVADREMTLLSWVYQEGNYGEYAVLSLQDEAGNLHIVATGAKVVLDTLHQVQDFPPDGLQVKFTKKGRYWTVE